MNKLAHVLITGGGSGLGLGMACRYLKRGANISVLDLTVLDENAAILDSAAQEGQARWMFVKADVTDDAMMVQSVKEAVGQFGQPDLAINSAGIVMNKAMVDMQASEFRRVIDINLNGSFHFAAAVLPEMRPNGRLALVASLAGLTSNYAYSAYGASKFGVVGLATTLRYEYEHADIHISCICPPEVRTPLVDGERAHGNPVSLELKKIAGSMEANDACDQIVAGLDSGRWMIIPGLSGKATAAAARYLPGPFFGLMNRMVKRALIKYPAQS
ncbi:SDR family NAD(P)-dependent oxidoreductase [Marinobacter sp. 1Y8]